MRPIAYTYDADTHCEDCAEARFGLDLDGFITGTDTEGNEVGVISPWDEWYANDVYEGNATATLVCGTCHGVILETILDA